MHSEKTSDPREKDPREAQTVDPESGASDDPRVDPTPQRRQKDSGSVLEPRVRSTT